MTKRWTNSFHTSNPCSRNTNPSYSLKVNSDTQIPFLTVLVVSRSGSGGGGGGSR